MRAARDRIFFGHRVDESRRENGVNIFKIRNFALRSEYAGSHPRRISGEVAKIREYTVFAIRRCLYKTMFGENWKRKYYRRCYVVPSRCMTHDENSKHRIAQTRVLCEQRFQDIPTRKFSRSRCVFSLARRLAVDEISIRTPGAGVSRAPDNCGEPLLNADEVSRT